MQGPVCRVGRLDWACRELSRGAVAEVFPSGGGEVVDRGHGGGDAFGGAAPQGRADPDGRVWREYYVVAYRARGNQARVMADERVDIMVVSLQNECVLGEADCDPLLQQKSCAKESGEQKSRNPKESRVLLRAEAHLNGHSA
ncbi:hypothetical protein ACSSS7_007908 [Eimeria intestinalis]